MSDMVHEINPSTSNEQEFIAEDVLMPRQSLCIALQDPLSNDIPEDENPQKKNGFNTSKRSQLIKMLCLTLLPILSLMGFTLFSLTDTINKKMENEKTRKELQLSVELGNLIHRLQQERDTSVLYLSALGPETKTFLLQEYIGTNNAIYALSEWPRNLDTDNREEFESRDRLREYLVRHRQLLTKVKYNLQVEIDFYTNIIRVVIAWLYDSITRGKDAEVWKTLVAYLKLTSGKQDVGIERALGTLFFVQGGFETSFSKQNYFEMYNTVIYRFRAFYETAELYSNRVDRLYTSGVSEAGSDLIAIIDGFRFEIQHYESEVFYPDIQKARYWFDNMTLYLDTLLKIQQNLGFEIIGRLDVVIDDSTRDLSISVSCLVIVLIMCPLVIFVADNLTSSIQRYALSLVSTTKQLSEEHKKINTLIYQMVPEVVAKRFQKDLFGNAENIKSMTVMFFDVHNFVALTSMCSTTVVVELLTNINNAIEKLTENNDAFHVQTYKDSNMIVAGT
ncbi:Atrial natriuretic peptide receptor 1 [Mizuhopecten yessoensis]|uniref:Atrial natriuretic peptide receptor 1 n=1 Tax=Mizuhopecten yessoensis TaxID=6573 RepID=A0A210PX40_MIZYE|nr:Atrial natriuretic peptide receptor 1 [Mizuhopecten yessoensis]